MYALLSFLRLSLSILLSVYTLNLGLAPTALAEDMKVVWVAEQGPGEQVYYSSGKDGSWSVPLQVSSDTVHLFQPAVAAGNDDKNWFIWSRKEVRGSSLQFSVLAASQISPALKIPTGMNTNTAAAIIVDPENIPVIAWEGSDKLYPDIYWSHWNGTGWEPAQKVHDDNNVPDINPSLQSDASGKITLSWLTFMEGKYAKVSKTLGQGKWVDNPELKPGDQAQRKMPSSLPGFIEDQRKATLFISDDDGARSIQPSR